jgi:hypothetical protein
VEEEALRRANDEVEPSIIAQEHHLLMGLFLHWEGLLLRWAPNAAQSSHPSEQGCYRRAMHVRAAIIEALRMLERKGTTAEARAMDTRLRVDHQELAQLMAGHAIITRLQELVELQKASTAGLDHLRAAVADLAGPIANAERLMGSIENAADYVCEKLVQRQPSERSRIKALATLLVTAAANTGAKVFFEQLVRMLG